MNQREMKNIKKPSYACSMAKGNFAGAKWMCTKCGKQVSTSSFPSSTFGGRCPDTSSGNHIWQQC